jgi:hypothetical protein
MGLPLRSVAPLLRRPVASAKLERHWWGSQLAFRVQGRVMVPSSTAASTLPLPLLLLLSLLSPGPL